MQILKVKVDNISLEESVKRIQGWVKKPGNQKYFVTTPNLEFIKDAQKDEEFQDILNRADLAVPDSSRIGWLKAYSGQEGFLRKLAVLPLGFVNFKNQLMQFDVVPGVDLMERLCRDSGDLGYTIGFLGGQDEVADKCAERLSKIYKNLKISFVRGGGDWQSPQNKTNIPQTDILFVAFGHKKQERWISQNLPNIPVKVAMGVGGSFDYLSGETPRAPLFLRKIGMEWFYRLTIQPWRIKRIFSLISFIFSLLFKKT